MSRTKIKCCGIILSLIIIIPLFGCSAKLYEETIESFDYGVYKDFPIYSSMDIYGEEVCFGSLTTAEDAAKAAEQIWFDAFDDNTEILKQRPYIVSYDDKNELWLIEGNPEYVKDFPGGTAHVLITSDGMLMTCWHTK